jgi:outer membrane biosynthesis protein TonB
MEVKVTIATTPELTGLALAVTNLLNGQTSFSLGQAVKEVVGKADTAKDEVVEDEKPAKEEKPKATRTRTKKEEPGVQEPPKKEEVEEEDEKPAKENKEDETESGAITIEDIRKVQRKVSLGGGIEKMKDLLATFGVESASELKESDYDAYYEKLVELV